MAILVYYLEIFTAVVDPIWWLSTLSIWKISNLKARGVDFMLVPITLVIICNSGDGNDSNEKHKMTMYKNRIGISMTCQTELYVRCRQLQRKHKIHDPQQQKRISKNTGLTRHYSQLLKYIWITSPIITLTQKWALLYECYLKRIS